MNLNDFVVLPNNKAKSVKRNARDLQKLEMETVTLAQESKEMEEQLHQLKESMSKEKQERGFKWKSGKCGSLNISALTNDAKKSKEIKFQKLSAGKVKIRVLKDEPLTAPPQPPAPRPAPTVGLRTTRTNRLKGTHCVQCEVKTAGLMCAECADGYCIGCFTKFHQKGALKLHRMIPIQTDLQTHVSTRDVVSSVQKQTNPSSSTSLAVAKPKQLQPHPSQVLTVDHGEEKKVEMSEEGERRKDGSGIHTSLLRGEYNEEESMRSFQEALKQWRGVKSAYKSGKSMNDEAMRTPVRPVSAMATQADLTPDRERGGRGERAPVRVECKESSLTYMDRLHLKKHRRTPIESYRPTLDCGTDLKSLPLSNSVEETASSLTAQEEDFRRYCASLFAVPVSRSRTEPQITTPESCLVIEVLHDSDEDTNGVFVAEQRTEKDNRKVPSVEQVLSKETLVPQTALTSGGSSRVSCSSPSPAQSSRQSGAPEQPKAAQSLHLSKPQTSQAEHSRKYTGDEISIYNLGLAPLEEDSSDKGEAQMLGRLTRGRSREERGNPAISHREDPFVPADADREIDLQTDEQDQLSEPSMVMLNQSSGSGSEQFCDLDGFMPRGLDMNSGRSASPEHIHCDPMHTFQTSPHDTDPTGSHSYEPSRSLTEEHLLYRMMKDNRMQPTKIHSSGPTRRGEISANKLGTSGSSLSGRSSSTLSHRPKRNPSPLSALVCPSVSKSPSLPLSACLSRPTLGSEIGPAFPPLSRAALEILEICGVDHTGCEDPDLDMDTTAHTLLSLEQEVRLMAKETGKQASVFGTGNSDGPDQRGNHHFTWGRASEEQKEEEAAAQKDQQSVLLLP